jgi:hypothetical protein
MKLLNADKLLKADKKVILNGREYSIPADLPVRIVVKMMHLSQEMQKNTEDFSLMEQSVDTLFEVFKLRNKDIKREDFDPTMEQYIEISKFIGDNGEDKDPEKA